MENLCEIELGVGSLILLFFVVLSFINALINRSLWLEEIRYEYLSNKDLQTKLKVSYRRSLLFSLAWSLILFFYMEWL